jgi:hypothetical protein
LTAKGPRCGSCPFLFPKAPTIFAVPTVLIRL